MRWRLLGADAPTPEMIAAGLPGWRAIEQRCAGTPYGAALQADRAAFAL
jgi:hypothetical protein